MLDPNTELHFVDSAEEVLAFYQWANSKNHPVLGIDTETTGLRIYQTDDHTSDGGEPPFRCRMIQVGDESHGWAFPTDPECSFAGVVLDFMRKYKGIWVAHNISYDARVLRTQYGFEFPWERTHDTMIMSQMLRPDKSAALKQATKELVDPRAATMQDQLDYAKTAGGWEWYNIPYSIEPYKLYSALDPVLAVHLWHALRADIVFPESFDLEMSALRLAIDMEHRGVQIDMEYSQRKAEELVQYSERARQWGIDNLGISIGSSRDLAKWFTEQGAELTKRTDSGALSVDKEVLESLAISPIESVSTVAKWVTHVKYQEKLAKNYFGNFMKFNIDGILHPNIKTMGAQTSGRMSITDPAMQTLPKSDKIVRRAILPNDGEVIVSADEDQMEFRIFAVLSGDQRLIDLFNDADASGSDPFTEIGKQIYNDPSFTKKDPRRGAVKSSVYGRLFGAGVKKQAETAGISVDHMQEIATSMEAMYEGFKTLPVSIQREVKASANKEEGVGYVDTMFTHRKIPVPLDKVYRGTNYRIQGTGSEMLKRNMVKMANAGLAEFMKLPVHDEIVLSVPPDIVDDVMPVLGECMTTEGWSVTFRAGSEYKGTSWAGNIDELDL